jgi:2-polyprenyl-3-methyl-5-hydroxy-6-metoxy-1,4-benzoquinol methylase
MGKIINTIHSSYFFGRIFHTLDYCLQKELKNCETVLDLGCGPSSPIKLCKNIRYSVGVEVYKPYIKESLKKGIHSKYINNKIEAVEFAKKSFDAVVMIEVLEHVDEKSGIKILKNANKWAKKKIVISSPNGFLKQKELDNNPWQKHLSGWNMEKLKSLGFICHGLAGLRFFRNETHNKTMGSDLLSTIRFHPRFFWFILATITQLITYYIPAVSFELFSVKYIDK